MVAGSPPSMLIPKRRSCTRPQETGSPTNHSTHTSAQKYNSNSVHNNVNTKKECIGDSSCTDQASFSALHQTFSSITDKQYGTIVEDDDVTCATMDGSLERMGTIAVLYQAHSFDECQNKYTSTRGRELNERVEIFFVPHPCSSLCPSSESSEKRDPPSDERDRSQPLPSSQSRPQPRPQPRPRSTLSRRPPLHKKGHVSLSHSKTKKQGQILPQPNKWEKVAETDTRSNGVPWEIFIKDFAYEGEKRSERYSQRDKRIVSPSLQIQDTLHNTSAIGLTKGQTMKRKTRLDVEQKQRKAYIESRVKSRLKQSKDLPNSLTTLRQVINSHHSTFRNQKTPAQGASRNIKTKTIEKRKDLSPLEYKGKDNDNGKAKIKEKVNHRSIVELLKIANAIGHQKTPRYRTQLNTPQSSHQIPSKTNSGFRNDLSKSNIYSKTGSKLSIRRSGERITQFSSPVRVPGNDKKTSFNIGHKADPCRFRQRSSSMSNKEGETRRLATNKSQKNTTKIKAEYGKAISSNQECFKRNDRGMNTRSTRRLNEEVSLKKHGGKTSYKHNPRQIAKKDKPSLPLLVKKKVTFLKSGSKLTPIVEDVPC